MSHTFAPSPAQMGAEQSIPEPTSADRDMIMEAIKEVRGCSARQLPRAGMRAACSVSRPLRLPGRVGAAVCALPLPRCAALSVGWLQLRRNAAQRASRSRRAPSAPRGRLASAAGRVAASALQRVRARARAAGRPVDPGVARTAAAFYSGGNRHRPAAQRDRLAGPPRALRSGPLGWSPPALNAARPLGVGLTLPNAARPALLRRRRGRECSRAASPSAPCWSWTARSSAGASLCKPVTVGRRLRKGRALYSAPSAHPHAPARAARAPRGA